MVNLGSSLLSDDFSYAQSERASFFNSLSKMIDSYAPAQFETKRALDNNSNNSSYSTVAPTEVIPFDSPMDQSLGSPASTRDFSNSPFHNYEFDFSGVEDAIMFPDHGTQEMHNDSYLAGMPLFNDVSIKQEATVTFPTASQQKEEMDRLNKAGPCDFSFDAMTHGVVPATTTTTINAPSPASSIASSTEGFESINQLAAVFVREYARTHPLNDIDVLLRALRVAGIAVSDQVVTDILASTRARSNSASSFSAASSPASSQAQSCCDHQHADASASVSPMTLPSAGPTSMAKTRSSLQVSARDNVAIDTRYGKRFVCGVCNKHFDRAFNLRTHALTHIDPDDRDKPFLCPWSECSKNFSRKYDAERHYRSVHLKRGEVATKQQVLMALSGRQYQDSEDDSPSNG